MRPQARRLVPTLVTVAVVLAVAVPALAGFTSGADTDCSTSIAPKAVAVDDFTGNGTPGAASVASGSIGGTDVSVWTNDGSWDATQCPNTGEDTYSLGSNPKPKGGIAAGNFTDDADEQTVDVDIVATGVNGDTGDHVIWVFENDGSGSFASVDEYTLSSGEVPTEAATADFNTDGYDDVVTANKQSNSASVFLNKGSNGSAGDRFQNPDHYSLSGGARDPVQVVTANMDNDTDNDGKDLPDVVIANTDSDNISVLINDGSGSLSDEGTTSVGTDPLGVTTGHFDDDAFPDVAVANSGDNTVGILENASSINGTWGGFDSFSRTTETTKSGPESVTSGDLLTSQGGTDLAAVSGQNIAVWNNDSSSDTTSWIKDGEYDVGTWKPRQVVTGDLDGDGEQDLVTAVDADQVSVLFN